MRNYRDVSPVVLGLTGDERGDSRDREPSCAASPTPFPSSMIASQSLIEGLRSLAKNDSIKGVILRVDSPGGDAIASDEILHEVRAEQEEAAVISMSDAAASGGYYISMSGDPIVAYHRRSPDRSASCSRSLC